MSCPYRRRDQRWLSVFNTTRQEIPPFAAMVIQGMDTSNGLSDGRLLVSVGQADAQTEIDQDPNWIIINSEQAIAPGGVGLGTQDYPAQVLYAPAEVPLVGQAGYFPIAQPLTHVNSIAGPAKDKWHLEIGRPAFSILGARKAAKSATKPGIAFVQPHTVGAFFRFGGAVPGSTLAVGDGVPLTALDTLTADFAQMVDPGTGATLTQLPDGLIVSDFPPFIGFHEVLLDIADKGGWKFKFPGLYQFGFSCTLSNPDPSTAGGLLALTLFQNGLPTRWRCGRLNTFGAQPVNSPPLLNAVPTAENVTLTGVLWIQSGDIITFINNGDWPATTGMFVYWFVRIAGA